MRITRQVNKTQQVPKADPTSDSTTFNLATEAGRQHKERLTIIERIEALEAAVAGMSSPDP